MRKIFAVTLGVLSLIAAVVFGSTLDISFEKQAHVPALQQDKTFIIVLQPEAPTPLYTPEDTPEVTLLKAIDALKPGFNGVTTPAARALAIQLRSNGYYYHVTYGDGTERINHETGNVHTVVDDVEFVISNTGVVLSADRYGIRTNKWGVKCEAAPSARPVIDALNLLRVKTLRAASRWNANPACEYSRY